MSINIFFCVLILTSTIFHYITSQPIIREYVVQSNFFYKLKGPEFSVYDKGQEHVRYRIESNHNTWRSLKVLEYPSKKEVGRLTLEPDRRRYIAQFSILDPTTNRWMDGMIKQNIQWGGSLLEIHLDGRNLTMKTEFGSLTTKFLNANERVLAQFRLRLASFFIGRKYDMTMRTNKYPDHFFFLGVAVQQHVVTTRQRGWKLFVIINNSIK